MKPVDAMDTISKNTNVPNNLLEISSFDIE